MPEESPPTVPFSGGRGTDLVPWIAGPIAGLAVVFLAVATLPRSGCEGPSVPGGAKAVVYAAIGLTSVATLAGAGWRLRALRRVGDASNAISIAAVPFALGALIVLPALLRIPGLDDLVYVFFLVGIVGTCLAGIALILAAIAGSGTDRAGSLVPLYLCGAALFWFPTLGLLGIALNEGILC